MAIREAVSAHTVKEQEFVLNAGDANIWLRAWQKKYPNRIIKNVNMTPNDSGWFVTIVYDMEV